MSCFAGHRLRLYQRAVQLYSVKLNKVIDIVSLKQIVEQCDLTYMGQIFKAVYLLFLILEAVNLVPHCVGDFSPLKHLARRDSIFNPGKLVE